MAIQSLSGDQRKFLIQLLKDSNRPVSTEDLVEALVEKFS